MDRGVAVFGDHALGDHDRVFEVVAVPGHEGDQHVLTQSEFAQVGRCAVSHHVTLVHHVATFDDGTLVDVGVLVGALVLDQVVNINADFTGNGFVVVDADHHAVGIDIIDHTTSLGDHDSARVNRRNALDAGANHGLFRTQHGHSLTLHVGTHQGAVRIVVLQEGHERGGHRHDLGRRDVHVLDALR